MILQSLVQFFDRIQGEDDNLYGVPTPGYSVQDVSFIISVNLDGSFVDILEMPRTGKKLQQLCLPGEGKSTGKITPKSVHKKAGYFWNDLSYMTGIELGDRPFFNELKFNAFRDNHVSLDKKIEEPHLAAVANFLKSWKAEVALELVERIKSFTKTGYGVFRVNDGSHRFLHERPEIKRWLMEQKSPRLKSQGKSTAQCLITGDLVSASDIARVHQPKIKGVGKNRTLLVSFEGDAYRSYGKDQSHNAPVSEPAVFAYCNALNALLSGPQSHRHRVIIGDVTTVFWTETKTTTESLFARVLSGNLDIERETTNIEDQTQHRQIEALLNILRKGGGASLTELDDKPDTKFFLLGLSGNVTRLVVRFWHVSTVGQMLDNLRDHYQNLSLACKNDRHAFWQPEFPSAQRLLDQTARDRKAVSPVLGGQLMQAILHRAPYPMTLLQGVLNRLKVVEKDQQGNTLERVPYLKAAILKAILIRNFNQTIDMSLNTERTETAYLLGRLFAALEKTQEDALGKVNAGIRERFYSSASATPGSVFPRIMRTYTHHLAKLEGGMKTNRERLIQAIHAPLDTYPAHLTLEQQGLFAIGYYHQRQDFFTKKETIEQPEPATA